MPRLTRRFSPTSTGAISSSGGIELNRLVGHQFTIGAVRCRGARLCEPCTVVQRYARRPVLRELVHRGGLRADILSDGEIGVGDAVAALAAG